MVQTADRNRVGAHTCAEGENRTIMVNPTYLGVKSASVTKSRCITDVGVPIDADGQDRYIS